MGAAHRGKSVDRAYPGLIPRIRRRSGEGTGAATPILGSVTVAAVIAVILLVVLVVFQVALALGAPLGDMSWGGQHPGVLPQRLRIASAIAGLVIYPIIILAILSASGLLRIEGLPVVGSAAMWILTAFFLLGTVMNSFSRSRRERIWGPTSLVIAGCCAVIALGL